ncbi:MAG: alpha-D-ribose 1-methylphosphonate 5-triphosphate diphosphatase, partial [Pseudomonadota bacterium]
MTVTRLANAMLVLEGECRPGGLVIENGLITGIETGRALPDGAEDMAGDFLAPGLIELHTDNLERHMQPRPGVKWPLSAAVLAHDAELA